MKKKRFEVQKLTKWTPETMAMWKWNPNSLLNIGKVPKKLV